jgi:basic membrane protein A
MVLNKSITTFVALSLIGTLVGGCGQARNDANAGGGKKTIKVALITDTGGLNDRSFNSLSYAGLQRAEKELGIQGDVVQSNSEADYVPNLTKFAQQGFNLVIAVGFLMTDAVEQVSKQYPNTKFLILDVPVTDRANVVGAVFKTEQSAYLAGAMAGLLERASGVAKMNEKNVVGVVGGMQIPPVTEYIAGFQQGVKKTNPSGTVLIKWTNSFTDQALGSQIAQSEISSGADIVFQLAGGAGIGVITAAKTAGVYAIGADADQSYLAPNTVLTSTLKGVDTATYDVIQQVQNNQFKSGVQSFDLADGGIGLAKFNSVVSQDIINQVNTLATQIKNGTLKVSANMQ